MKRQIVILGVLLLAVLPIAAQDWPAEMAGEQIVYQEPVRFQMYLSVWNDRNPWGMPSPVGHFFYFGDLTFDVCEGVNVAVLDLDTRASRTCLPTPWGGRFPQICNYWFPKPIQISYTLEWNEDAQAYLKYGVAEWGTNVIALSIYSDDELDGGLMMGVMQVVDGKMVWDENYTWYIYPIAPMTAIPQAPNPKRVIARRLPRQ